MGGVYLIEGHIAIVRGGYGENAEMVYIYNVLCRPFSFIRSPNPSKVGSTTQDLMAPRQASCFFFGVTIG